MARGAATRLDVRLHPRHKHLVEEAANLIGRSVSAFTVATLVREAEQVISSFGALRLSNRDRDAFLAALEKPPAPSARLRRAVRRWRRQVAS